jgi:diguanylate cyclase (GGDEF)-like protein
MNDELAQLVERATRGLQAANSQLAQQAMVDDLTKLSNRRALWQRISDLEQAQADSYLPVQLLLFDLDNFKEVNDTLGHAAGDEVLMHVAAMSF